MARRRVAWRVARTGLLLLIVAMVAAAGLRAAGMLPAVPHVAVVELQGVIADAVPVVETLDRLRTREPVVAVVLRIDSPGGAVAPSQEIYDAVVRLGAVKPVVASLGNIAASGGYYVAAATDHVVAAPGTLTGSLGAIMHVRHLGALAEKLGVGATAVKSGPYKDIGNPLRPLAAEEERLLQAMIDDVLRQFVEAVAAGRGMAIPTVRALADGRLFSGAQARAVGLVDELGGLELAVARAWSRAGRTDEPVRTWVRPWRTPWWWRLVADAATPFGADLGGGLLFLYGDTATLGPLARP